jgi:molybdopterin-guanine dinucleotide biosynthesis protein B
MKIFGIAGWSGSGKTTLLVRGLVVGTLKHTHHEPLVGDDDCRALAAAGACETMVVSPARFALVHELAGAPEPGLYDLAARFAGLELLLVEGFKGSPHPKLEVWSPGQPLLATDPKLNVVALAADAQVPGVALPRFGRDDIGAIADFIAGFGG